jgi:hypothetical protein
MSSEIENMEPKRKKWKRTGIAVKKPKIRRGIQIPLKVSKADELLSYSILM